MPPQAPLAHCPTCRRSARWCLMARCDAAASLRPAGPAAGAPAGWQASAPPRGACDAGSAATAGRAARADGARRTRRRAAAACGSATQCARSRAWSPAALTRTTRRAAHAGPCRVGFVARAAPDVAVRGRHRPCVTIASKRAGLVAGGRVPGRQRDGAVRRVRRPRPGRAQGLQRDRRAAAQAARRVPGLPGARPARPGGSPGWGQAQLPTEGMHACLLLDVIICRAAQPIRHARQVVASWHGRRMRVSPHACVPWQRRRGGESGTRAAAGAAVP